MLCNYGGQRGSKLNIYIPLDFLGKTQNWKGKKGNKPGIKN
jgi:hypothetical protein